MLHYMRTLTYLHCYNMYVSRITAIDTSRTDFSSSHVHVCILCKRPQLVIGLLLWCGERRPVTYVDNLLLTSICNNGNPALQNEVCLTPECVMVAGKVMGKMDMQQDPCEDFYEYACAGFDNNPQNPQDVRAWSSISKLAKTNQVYVKRVSYISMIAKTNGACVKSVSSISRLIRTNQTFV